jgi:hypothetical protein
MKDIVQDRFIGVIKTLIDLLHASINTRQTHLQHGTKSQLSLHCIYDYRIISCRVSAPSLSSVCIPSALHSSSPSPSVTVCRSLRQPRCCSACSARLYETVGKGVTPPDSSGTEQDDDGECQSHQDPGDPSECLGGDNLVAVDQTV